MNDLSIPSADDLKRQYESLRARRAELIDQLADVERAIAVFDDARRGYTRGAGVSAVASALHILSAAGPMSFKALVAAVSARCNASPSSIAQSISRAGKEGVLSRANGVYSLPNEASGE